MFHNHKSEEAQQRLSEQEKVFAKRFVFVTKLSDLMFIVPGVMGHIRMISGVLVIWKSILKRVYWLSCPRIINRFSSNPLLAKWMTWVRTPKPN